MIKTNGTISKKCKNFCDPYIQVTIAIKTKKGPRSSHKRELRMNAWIFKNVDKDNRIVRKIFCDAIGIMIREDDGSELLKLRCQKRQ